MLYLLFLLRVEVCKKMLNKNRIFDIIDTNCFFERRYKNVFSFDPAKCDDVDCFSNLSSNLCMFAYITKV